MAAPLQVSKPDKQRKYDDAFKAEALRLAGESRSTRAVARQLGISEKLLYRWQQQQAVVAAGSADQARDPEWWALRAENQRLQRELAILQKALAIFSSETPRAATTSSINTAAKRRCGSCAQRCGWPRATTTPGAKAASS